VRPFPRVHLCVTHWVMADPSRTKGVGAEAELDQPSASSAGRSFMRCASTLGERS
jgi:hypothetical protein